MVSRHGISANVSHQYKTKSNKDNFQAARDKERTNPEIELIDEDCWVIADSQTSAISARTLNH